MGEVGGVEKGGFGKEELEKRENCGGFNLEEKENEVEVRGYNKSGEEEKKQSVGSVMSEP